MKRTFLTLALAMVAANPAFAARITNLDKVAHVVTFERAGSVQEQVVQPQRTVYFQAADGIVSMKGGTPAKSSLNSDGLLSGVIGAVRTTQIPAGPGDDFVIWPGGKMHLQRRIKSFTSGS